MSENKLHNKQVIRQVAGVLWNSHVFWFKKHPTPKKGTEKRNTLPKHISKPESY